MSNKMFDHHYSMKRIVLVNSASHGYSEIMLDEHLAMFGNNNRGKTASLAATKLLLYPESDFADCEKKFKFTSKSRLFKKEESYEYYFPQANSYLILEVENPAGIFCMILYRIGNYQYHRLFIPKSYEELRPHFWNSATETLATQLSVEHLQVLTKEYNGIQVGDDRQLAKLMYGNFASKDSRYCIVPLKDSNSESIKAFISLYELAFNAGKDESDKLPDAIATIIEMKRNRPEEKLDVTFTDLHEEYYTLLGEKEALQKLINSAPIYDALKQEFSELKGRHDQFSLQYMAFTKAFYEKREAHVQEASLIHAEIETLDTQLYSNKKQLKELENHIIAQKTLLINSEASTQNNRNKQQQVESFLGTFTADSPQQAAEMARTSLIDKINALEAQLMLIDNQAQTVEIYQKTQKAKHQLEIKISRCQKQLDNIADATLTHLSRHSATTLYNIRPEFGDLSEVLTAEEHNIIEGFSALFTCEEGNLKFKNTLFSTIKTTAYHHETHQQNLKEQKMILEVEHQNILKELTTLETILVSQNDVQRSTTQKAKLVQKKSDAERLLSLVSAYVLIVKEVLEGEEKIIQYQLSIESLDKNIVAVADVLQDIMGQRKNLAVKDQALKKFDESRIAIERVISNISAMIAVDFITEDNLALKTLQVTVEVSRDQADALKDLLFSINKEINDFGHRFSRFKEEVVIEEIDPYKEINQFIEYGPLIQKYSSCFETLLHQEMVLNQKISAHNQFLSNVIQELENANQLLSGTISTKNSELSQHPISNFQSVRLKLSMRADFKNLLERCRKHDMSQASLMEVEFYEMILSYIRKHFKKKNSKIRMRDLIDKIDYEFVGFDGCTETKPQSGGTTSTVTAFIISMLLTEIFRTDYQLRMPLIIDEIADIDESNIQAIVKEADRAGFSIFSATPTSNPVVCKYIGNWVHINLHRFGEVGNTDGLLHIMPYSINRFGA